MNRDRLFIASATHAIIWVTKTDGGGAAVPLDKGGGDAVAGGLDEWQDRVNKENPPSTCYNFLLQHSFVRYSLFTPETGLEEVRTIEQLNYLFHTTVIT